MQDLRSNLSDRNPYRLSKHRFYELKHFCLQYEEWRKLYHELLSEFNTTSVITIKKRTGFSTPTEDIANVMASLSFNARLVERTAYNASDELGEYIFMAVTKERSYNNLRTMYNIPCGRDYFYNLLRKFYWMLSEEKGL